MQMLLGCKFTLLIIWIAAAQFQSEVSATDECEREHNQHCHKWAQCERRQEDPKPRCYCSPGFRGDGRNCHRDDQQQQSERRCPQPGNIDRGSFTTGDGSYKVGTIITYSCQNQYRLQGNSQRTCQQNSQWSGQPPKCEKSAQNGNKGRTCQRPQNLDQGSVSGGGNYGLNSKISYKCNEGLMLVGNGERRCLASGQWSGTHPRCEKSTDCEREQSKHCHKWAQCERRQEDKKPRCYCSPGYNGDGHNCHQRRQDECEKRNHHRCHEHADCVRISDEKYKCKCRDSYKGDGVSCQTKGCSKPSGITNGKLLTNQQTFVSGNIVSYQCEYGYIMMGNPQISCGDDSLWSGTIPRCEKSQEAPKQKICRRPQDIQNGYIKVSDGPLKPGSTVSYECRKPHKIVGNSQRSCQHDGKWSGNMPMCKKPQQAQQAQVKKACNRPQDIQNGNTKVSDGTLKPGATVSYECRKPFKLVGNSRLTCQHDGRWSGNFPKCRKPQQAHQAMVTCKRPQDIQNGNTKIRDESLRPGSTVTYECRKPFKLVGNAQLTCQNDGRWSGTKPKCTRQQSTPNKCQRPQEVPNADMQASDWNFKPNSVVTYKCRGSYKLEGNAKRTCQENGRWSGSIPKCKEDKKKCKRLPSNIPHGTVSSNDYQFRAGAIVTYTCQRDYKIQGNGQRTCQNDGKWSGMQPRCQKKKKDKCQNRCHENAECKIVQGKGECHCREPFYGDGYNCQACNKDQIYSNCASRCPATCDQPNPVCHKACDPSNKCMCPNRKVQVSLTDKTCIALADCKK